MTDPMDRLLDQSRPGNVSDLPGVAESARRVAERAASEQISRHRRPRIWRWPVMGLVALAVSAGAIPPLIWWAPWEPDVVISREFPITDGGEPTECVVVVRVAREGVSDNAELDRQVEEARRYLQEEDWSSISVDLDDLDSYLNSLPPAQRELREQTGISPPAILAMLTSNKVSEAFERAGYLTSGVVIESAGRCDEVTE